MTLNRIAKTTALVVLFSASGFASAVGDSQNIAVSGTVQAVCKFFNATQTLAFGTLDPSFVAPATGDVEKTATVSYKCTKNATAPTLKVGGMTAGPVTRNMSVGGVNLPYTVTWTAPAAGAATGFSGTAKEVILTGAVDGTAYQDLPAGAYVDTLVVDIAP